jgi:uncharacterized protein (DUF58 family)
MLRRLLFRNLALAHRIGSWFRRRFSPLGRVLLFFMLVAAVFGFNTRMAATYQLFTLLAALFGLAWAWSAFAARLPLPLVAERKLPRYATVGEALHYSLTLRNTGRRAQRGLSLLDQLAGGPPDWAEFIAAADPGEARRNAFDRYIGFPKWQGLMRARRGANLTEQALPDLPPGRPITLEQTLTPLRRGRLQFAAACFHRPEPFGLMRSQHLLPLPQSCCVLPRQYPASPLPASGGRAYQRGGVALTNTVGDSEEFMSLREYRQGDPLRSVHWKSSAKFGRWLVKEFQEEYFVRRALVLDTFCPPARTADFEAAVSAAASLAVAEAGNDSLLDLMFVERQAHCFTAGRGLAQTSALLEVLAGVLPSSQGDFTVLAQNVLRRATALSSVACVLLDWDEARRTLAETLLGLNLPVAVLLVREAAPEQPPHPGLFLRHVRPGHLAEDLRWT